MKLGFPLLTFFCVASVTALADPTFNGAYTVPLADPALAPHATFEVSVKKQAEHGVLRSIEIELPFELSGQHSYRQKFVRIPAEEGFVAFESVKHAGAAKDALKCSVAKGEGRVLCLANWSSLRYPIDEVALKEHLLRSNPDLSNSDLAAKIQVSRAFSGDAIGILSYEADDLLK
jgi:hypothetical protein